MYPSVQVGEPGFQRQLSSAGRNIASKGFDGARATLSIVERDILLGLPEPDDYRTSIHRQVDYEPWVLHNPPPLMDLKLLRANVAA